MNYDNLHAIIERYCDKSKGKQWVRYLFAVLFGEILC